MNRTEKLKRYCEGRKKHHVAQNTLGVHRGMLSFLLKYDLDELIAKIDSLPIEDTQPRRQKRKVA